MFSVRTDKALSEPTVNSAISNRLPAMFLLTTDLWNGLYVKLMSMLYI